jgi:Zn-dependent protease
MPFVPSCATLLWSLIFINVVLITFNLIPLPPLDAFVLLRHLCRLSEETCLALRRWSILVVMLALYVGPVRHVFGIVMETLLRAFATLSSVVGTL